MRYYKIVNGDYLLAVGSGNAGDEITEAEYNTLLAEIREKVALIDKIYSSEITIADVPTEWQEEIQRRVDERIAAESAVAEQDIPAEEALGIILGGETA